MSTVRKQVPCHDKRPGRSRPEQCGRITLPTGARRLKKVGASPPAAAGMIKPVVRLVFRLQVIDNNNHPLMPTDYAYATSKHFKDSYDAGLGWYAVMNDRNRVSKLIHHLSYALP
jgi:hypothetical protein